MPDTSSDQRAESVAVSREDAVCLNCRESIHRYGYGSWEDEAFSDICIEVSALDGLFEEHIPMQHNDG